MAGNAESSKRMMGHLSRQGPRKVCVGAGGNPKSLSRYVFREKHFMPLSNTKLGFMSEVVYLKDLEKTFKHQFLLSALLMLLSFHFTHK